MLQLISNLGVWIMRNPVFACVAITSGCLIISKFASWYNR